MNESIILVGSIFVVIGIGIILYVNHQEKYKNHTTGTM